MMTEEIRQQEYFPIPALPGLAVTVAGPQVPESLQQEDVLNVLSGNLDGSMLYVVAWLGQDRGSVYEGWIHGTAARMLSEAEGIRVPKELRLPINEVMKRSTFVEVREHWSHMHPATLALRMEEVVQVSLVQKGWAFGWSLKSSRRMGWFPLNKSEFIASSLLRIGKEEDEPLVPAAVDSLIDLIAAAEQPLPRQWHWEGELPAMVAESHQHELRAWRERCAEEEAAKQELNADLDGEEDAGQGQSDKFDAFIRHEDLSDVECPLLICTDSFAPPKRLEASESAIFLALQLGDLVRVTSLMKSDMQWYYGQLNGQEAVKGWFPKRSVQLAPCQISARTEGLLEQAFSGMTVTLPKIPTEHSDRAVH